MNRGRTLGVVVAGLLVVGAIAGVLRLTASDEDPSARSTTTSTTRPLAEPVVGDVGTSGVGDAYFPGAGNGGYDVEHYDLDLVWLADDARLQGEAAITATATQALRRFNLDLVGLEVASVAVDDEPATFTREGRELVVTPADAIDDGAEFTAVVTYAGRPEPIDEGTEIFEPGWQIDGREAFVVGEPTGAATWFPGNDHPSDKATFTFRVTAPDDQTVAANGLLTEREPVGDGTTRWTYTSDDVMATYLAQVAIGDLELVDGGTVDGVQIRHALHRDSLGSSRRAVASTGEMLEFLQGLFGPYPFDAYGVVAVATPLGFALETQTLTIISSDILEGGAGLILLHELAHQWVGNAVTPAAWEDIWLNEGFATYSEWLWTEARGGPSAASIARGQRSRSLDVPAGDPGPVELFADTVYQRGALTLQALREAIGDDAFFELLERWVTDNAGTSVRTQDFVDLAEEVGGQDLDVLFRAWLDNVGLPSLD